MKPNKIVFAAHDFSLASKNALELAADLAYKTGSRLFIYHVVSTSVLADSENLYTYNPEVDIKKASALLRRGITYLKKSRPGMQIAFEVDYGFLIPTIAEKVEALSPWISVVGVKKRTGLDKVIFGDVCTTLIGKIQCPLFVVPFNSKSLNIDHIAYAWDGKSAEVHQLSALREMLGSQNASITALNVSHYDEAVERNAGNFKQGLKKMFSSQSIDLKQIQGLDKEVEFEKAIKNLKPDLLVVYAHHYNVWQNLFHKRFSRYALKFTQSPVLIVC
jgi:nucleotide-binding universal stress UspA family protein